MQNGRLSQYQENSAMQLAAKTHFDVDVTLRQSVWLPKDVPKNIIHLKYIVYLFDPKIQLLMIFFYSKLSLVVHCGINSN